MFLSKLKILRKEENKELITHSLFSLIIRLSGAGITFLMNIVVARFLGVVEAGYFFLAVTVTTLLATIGRIGADVAVLRFVSIYSELKEWNKVREVIKTILKWTYLPLVILTFLVCLFAKQIAIYFFHKPEFQWPLFWAALSMPLLGAYNIYSMALQGRKKILLSVTSMRVLTPLFLIIFFFIFYPTNSVTTSIYYLAACIINLIIAYFWWKSNVPDLETNRIIDKSELWKSCMHLWVIAIMQQLILWGGQFVAGIYNTPAEVAQLSVSRTIASLITFILSAVNTVSAPRFASMYNQGKINQLKNYARNTTRLMTLVALPITLFLIFFPSFVMSLFGKGFSDGKLFLVILALGQFINVSTGSVGYLLTMSGHEKQFKNITIITAIGSTILAFILNIAFGAIGSAVASALALAVSNLLAVRLVKRKLGFNTMNIFGFE